VLKKQVAVLLCMICISSISFSQSWRENLETARNQYAIKNYPAAYKTYQQVAKQLPSNIQLDAEIGQAAYKAGDYTKAAQYFSKQKNAARTKKARLNHNLGNAYLQQKNYQKAIEAYKNSLRTNPSDEKTRYNLALAMQKQKNQQKNEPKNNKNKQAPKKDPPKNNQPKEDNQEKKQPEEADKQLKQNATDRMLDDLMKRELDTKQKHRGKPNKKTNENGKDW
jgi:tetratricopeptide (TPR) repeat protein